MLAHNQNSNNFTQSQGFLHPGSFSSVGFDSMVNGTDSSPSPSASTVGSGCEPPLSANTFTDDFREFGDFGSPDLSQSLSPGSAPPSTSGAAFGIYQHSAPPTPGFPSSFSSPYVQQVQSLSQSSALAPLDPIGLSEEASHALLRIALSRPVQPPQMGFAYHSGRVAFSFGLGIFPFASGTGSPNTRENEIAVNSNGNKRRRTYHHSLRNALILWGAYRARGAPFVSPALERALEQRVANGVKEAVMSSQYADSPSSSGSELDRGEASEDNKDKVLHALDATQALVLLARYCFATGRAREGRFHVSGAADLTIQLGLHQLHAPAHSSASTDPSVAVVPVSCDPNSAVLILPAPEDTVELGVRVRLFWEIYTLDRLLSAHLRLPPVLAALDSSTEPGSQVDTPWPEELGDYAALPSNAFENVCSPVGTAQGTLRTFFVQQGAQLAGAPSGGYSVPALRAKGAALLCAAGRVADSWGSYNPSPRPNATFPDGTTSSPGTQQLQDNNPSAAFAALERTLARYAASLIPLQQLAAGLSSDERRIQAELHLLLCSARVRLNLHLARAGVRDSLEACVRAGRAAAGLARLLGASVVAGNEIPGLMESEWDGWDGLVGVCCSIFFRLLI